jgi:hypothetical protein
MNLLSISASEREAVPNPIDKYRSSDPSLYNRQGKNEVQFLVNSGSPFTMGDQFSIPVGNAIAYFNAAIQVDDKLVEPVINLSLLYAYGGYFAIASDYSYKALLLSPNLPSIQFIHQCFSGGVSSLSVLTELADLLPEYKEELIRVLALLYGLSVKDLNEKEQMSEEKQLLQELVSGGLLNFDESIWALTTPRT